MDTDKVIETVTIDDNGDVLDVTVDRRRERSGTPQSTSSSTLPSSSLTALTSRTSQELAPSPVFPAHVLKEFSPIPDFRDNVSSELPRISRIPVPSHHSPDKDIQVLPPPRQRSKSPARKPAASLNAKDSNNTFMVPTARKRTVNSERPAQNVMNETMSSIRTRTRSRQLDTSVDLNQTLPSPRPSARKTTRGHGSSADDRTAASTRKKTTVSDYYDAVPLGVLNTRGRATVPLDDGSSSADDMPLRVSMRQHLQGVAQMTQIKTAAAAGVTPDKKDAAAAAAVASQSSTESNKSTRSSARATTPKCPTRSTSRPRGRPPGSSNKKASTPPREDVSSNKSTPQLVRRSSRRRNSTSSNGSANVSMTAEPDSGTRQRRTAAANGRTLSPPRVVEKKKDDGEMNATFEEKSSPQQWMRSKIPNSTTFVRLLLVALYVLVLFLAARWFFVSGALDATCKATANAYRTVAAQGASIYGKAAAKLASYRT